MGGRTMPDRCPHGRVLDWGDFGPNADGSVGTERCEQCEIRAQAKFRASAVQCVTAMARDDELVPEERRALLDALGHDDCVPREHRGCHWEHEAQRYAGNADYWRDRAEALLREAWEMEGHAWRYLRRNAQLRADNERLRVTISTARNIVGQWLADGDGDDTDKADLYDCLDHALSADADADAEPCAHESWTLQGNWCRCTDCGHGWPASERCPRCGITISEWKRWGQTTGEVCEDCDAEPSTCGAPHDICGTWCELPEGHDGECRCVCDGDPGHDWLCNLNPCDCGADAELEPSRAEGDEYETVGGGGCEHMWWTDRRCIYCGAYRDAEGGRPREADPQGDSPSTGASVDGGGDDGRSRAIEAATRCGTDGLCWSDAENAIDAALASGGVVTAEQQTATGVELAEERARRQYDEARVRDLEGALREAVGSLEQHRRDMHRRSPRPCATCTRSENTIHRASHVLRKGAGDA